LYRALHGHERRLRGRHCRGRHHHPPRHRRLRSAEQPGPLTARPRYEGVGTFMYNAPMEMTDQQIGFIGAGNMADALIHGLIATGVPAKNLWVSNRGPEKLEPLREAGVNTTVDNAAIIPRTSVILLAVKPQQMRA